ncbi:hypothetical protein [Streptomyces flaveolus]|uniref:hypothetical protein n=1 Tax=Streptomyces flaveolus TaxID=67297 RepID=UPI00332A65B5
MAEAVDHLGADGKAEIIDGIEIRVRRPAAGNRPLLGGYGAVAMNAAVTAAMTEYGSRLANDHHGKGISLRTKCVTV